jgi:hypothetical protein
MCYTKAVIDCIVSKNQLIDILKHIEFPKERVVESVDNP